LSAFLLFSAKNASAESLTRQLAGNAHQKGGQAQKKNDYF